MIKESDIVKSTPLADNVTNSGNSYIKFYSEYEYCTVLGQSGGVCNYDET